MTGNGVCDSLSVCNFLQVLITSHDMIQVMILYTSIVYEYELFLQLTFDYTRHSQDCRGPGI